MVLYDVQTNHYNSDYDRLSELPDHILLCILERLRDDVRLLARTYALSRRWSTIPLMLPGLEISVGTFVPAAYGSTSTLQRVHHAMDKFTGAVRFFLTAAGGHRAIKTLRLKLYLTEFDQLRGIGELVGDAIGRGEVRDLELLIYTEKGKSFLRSAPENLKFVLCYGRRLMDLLRGAPAAVFRSVRVLQLQNLCFRAPCDVAGVLLGTCPALETLALDACGFAEFSGSVLAVDAPRSQLKALSLTDCYFEGVHLVQAPNLAKLYFERWYSKSSPVTFGPGSVPSLVKITLRHRAEAWQQSFNLSELLENAHGVAKLCLAFEDDKIWVAPEDTKRLDRSAACGKLRVLHLVSVFPEGDLSWTMFFLQAAPLLAVLDINVYRNHVCRPADNDRDIEELPWEVPHGFRHHRLRIVRVHGGINAGKDVRFARLVLERAVNLELLVLQGRVMCQGCAAADPSIVLSRFPEDKNSIDALVRQLKGGISTPARICISCV